MVTKSQVQHANPQAVIDNIVLSWPGVGQAMEAKAKDYKNALDRPGGSVWEGHTAEAAQHRGAEDEKAVGQMSVGVEEMTHNVVNKISGDVIPPWKNANQLIENVEKLAGFTVNEDLSVSYSAPEGTSAETEKKCQNAVTEFAQQIRDAADRWWSAELDAAQYINAQGAAVKKNFNPLGALNSAEGADDGRSLLNGGGTYGWEPEMLERLIAAGNLSPQDLAKLARGESVQIGSGQMAYLYQVAQSLNGKSVEEIKTIENALPPQARAALAQGLQILSNDHIMSGVGGKDTREGVTDATRDDFIPAAGSVGNLPSEMVKELTRTDRVTRGIDADRGPIVSTTRLNGVGAMQDIADIFRPGQAGYANGSEATKSMLAAASQYAAADATHRGAGFNDALFSDQHGVGPHEPADPRGALAEVLQVAGRDHVGIHDLATNPAGKDAFLHGLLTENWGDKSGQVGDVFRWMDDDTHNRINGETASSVAHYVAEHSHELNMLPGGGTFGHDNPGVAHGIAEGLSPYLKDFAGLQSSPDSGITAFTHEGMDRRGPEVGLADLFDVLNRDHESATIINGAAVSQYQQILADAAQNGSNGVDLQIAGRLGQAMKDGAEMSQLFDRETAQWEALQGDPDQLKQWLKSTASALGKIPGPVGNIAWAAEQVLGLPSDQSLLNPALIQGGPDFMQNLVNLSGADNETARQAAFLSGLIERDPVIAQDPTLSKIITPDGQVDWARVGDMYVGAQRILSQWFNTDPSNPGSAVTTWGVDLDSWESRIRAGAENNDWSY